LPDSSFEEVRTYLRLIKGVVNSCKFAVVNSGKFVLGASCTHMTVHKRILCDLSLQMTFHIANYLQESSLSQVSPIVCVVYNCLQLF